MEPYSPVYQTNEEGQESKYFLKGQDDNPSGHSEDLQISEGQFRAIINYGKSTTVSGDLSEASIVKLHAEQDPSSPLFEGSEPVNSGVSGTAAEKASPATTYYEPTTDKVDPIADATPEPQGTTAISTEEATKPYEAPEPEATANPVTETPIAADPVQASSEPVEAVTSTEEDASITGA